MLSTKKAAGSDGFEVLTTCCLFEGMKYTARKWSTMCSYYIMCGGMQRPPLGSATILWHRLQCWWGELWAWTGVLVMHQLVSVWDTKIMLILAIEPGNPGLPPDTLGSLKHPQRWWRVLFVSITICLGSNNWLWVSSLMLCILLKLCTQFDIVVNCSGDESWGHFSSVGCHCYHHQ